MKLFFLILVIVGTPNLFLDNEIRGRFYFDEHVTPNDWKELYKEKLKKYEGNLVELKSDVGGLTNKGITWNTFQKLSFLNGKKYDKKCFLEMPDSIWNFIFDLHWNYFAGVEDIKIKTFLTDYFWASGFYSFIHIQRAVKTLVNTQKLDGVWSASTIKNINSIESKSLILALYHQRTIHLKSLNKPMFINGWLNRLDDFKNFLLKK